MSGIDRLLQLRERMTEQRAVMRELAPRFAHIENRQIEGTAPRALTGFNLFQTPKPIARRMAEILRERVSGGRILEPSAGLGRLYEPLEDLRADWLMIEEAGELVRALKSAIKSQRIDQRDFLETSAEDLGGQVDGVIMNPPFKMGRDIKHIRHALDMLKPGGRLVSLCYNGVKQNAELKPIADRWEVLPAGSFREEGTSADVALLVIDK